MDFTAQKGAAHLLKAATAQKYPIYLPAWCGPIMFCKVDIVAIRIIGNEKATKKQPIIHAGYAKYPGKQSIRQSAPTIERIQPKKQNMRSFIFLENQCTNINPRINTTVNKQ